MDGLLGAAVAAAMTLMISIAHEPGSRPVDSSAYTYGFVIGALVPLSRRWPLGVLTGTAMTMLAYYITGYPGMSMAVPLAVAVYQATAAGKLRWCVLVVGFFTCAGLLVRLSNPNVQPWEAAADKLRDVALLVSIILLAESIRSHRQRLVHDRERLRRLEEDKTREAARRFAEERLRVAREVHDVLGHTISAMTVQAALADELLDTRPAQARLALSRVRSAGREAIVELRDTVGLLRAGEPLGAPRTPVGGLARLEELTAVAASAGLRMTITRDGAQRPLPSVVDVAAWRIIQESLTNVITHAAASNVEVGIRYEPDAVLIDIVDDGRGSVGNVTELGGHGVIGMRERALAVGGQLEAGSRDEGGFRVHAILPRGRSSWRCG